MRFLTLYIVIFSGTFLVAQVPQGPYYKAQTKIDELIAASVKIDGTIKSDRNFLIQISEGSINKTDSLNQKIGDGGFAKYTYYHEYKSGKFKIEYGQSFHYKYGTKDTLNANTENIEVNIYFENNMPFFAVFNEYHYNAEHLLFANRYYFQLNDTGSDVYYTNKAQEEMRNFIFDLID